MAKTPILYPEDYNGKYVSFDVGYQGDKAGITFHFARAVRSAYGEGVQHLKHGDRHFDVITTSDSFDKARLAKAIENKDGQYTEHDVLVLQAGQQVLESFIKDNGETNPYSAADWEEPVHAFG